MKRFVAYLYQYQNEMRKKNVGFLRVNLSREKVVIQMHIKLQEAHLQNAQVCLLLKKEGDAPVEGIPFAHIQLKHGRHDGCCEIQLEKGKFYEYKWTEFGGIGIRLEQGDDLIATWGFDDAVTKVEIMKVSPKQEEIVEQEVVIKPEEYFVEKDTSPSKPTYKKISLQEIYQLPSSCWYLANNSFLLHGFWSYGYLILKEDIDESRGIKTTYLGVPGVFEEPELVMATHFGFGEFEAYQQTKEKDFGCWYAKLQI